MKKIEGRNLDAMQLWRRRPVKGLIRLLRHFGRSFLSKFLFLVNMRSKLNLHKIFITRSYAPNSV